MQSQEGRENITFKNTLKLDQLVNYVEKEWGHEEWIVNNSKYCGKKLIFKASYQLSMHHHKIKEETFYLLSGKIFLETEYNGLLETRLMEPGDVAHIRQGMWHRITAIVDSEVIEFSTQHFDEDSYRRSKSCKVDLKALNLDLYLNE